MECVFMRVRLSQLLCIRYIMGRSVSRSVKKYENLSFISGYIKELGLQGMGN